MDLTIVSAFLTDINNLRGIDKYISLAKILVELDIPKVIFIDRKIFEMNIFKINKNTKFIPLEKDNLIFYEYKNQINIDKVNRNKDKDTIEYMMVQCHKNEWVKEAINMDFFKTNNYCWIDFGIYHIFKENIDLFTTSIKHICNKSNKTSDKIRLPGCWPLNYDKGEYLFYNICWYFCGGFFYGNKNTLLKFADLMKEKVITYITEKNSIIWEVNFWYLIYKDHPELFEWYLGDHNSSMFLNF